jgi:hypothetical protein
MFAAMAHSHFFSGEFEKSVVFAEETVKLAFNESFLRRLSIAAHALGGRTTEAQAMLEQLLLTEPAATISKLAKMMPYHRPEDRARLADGLRLAGLPE